MKDMLPVLVWTTDRGMCANIAGPLYPAAKCDEAATSGERRFGITELGDKCLMVLTIDHPAFGGHQVLCASREIAKQRAEELERMECCRGDHIRQFVAPDTTPHTEIPRLVRNYLQRMHQNDEIQNLRVSRASYPTSRPGIVEYDCVYRTSNRHAT